MSVSTLAPAPAAVQHPIWCKKDLTFGEESVCHQRYGPTVMGETGERIELSLNRDCGDGEADEDYITVFVGARYGPAREMVQLSRADARTLFTSGLALLALSEVEQ